jgi:phosphate transport system permease protein
MQLSTRKLLDRSFSGLGIFSIILLAAALAVILCPIVIGGSKAFIFKGTIEHRRLMSEKFSRGDREELKQELAQVAVARAPVYEALANFEDELGKMRPADRRRYNAPLKEFKLHLHALLGPAPAAPRPVLARDQYGQTRWDRAQVALQGIMFKEEYDYSDPTKLGVKVQAPRANDFKDTALAPVFNYIPDHLDEMLAPRVTFYWRFLFDESLDSHFFGGIWPELLGTFYLTLGAMLFAIPMGVISAIYFVEYAGDNHFVSILRTFISTLAGVPSIVFGLFGLAFFINTLHVSSSKSVLAGSLTLALLVMPLIIRSAEEAIRAVPLTYKEAALSVGASRWRTIMKVIVPAALPGILTGIVISMGRAAGETAPIIFTAAVSVGKPLQVLETLSEPTPALSWNIYNLATEHEAVDKIRHVQYGMVLSLVLLVLLLNVFAIFLRARIARKLKG